ncbi:MULTISPECIES: HIT family protein [Acidianus]|uniref:HIT family hydrolase n=1 Tax=Candidatus Acidianus copahuensis TaxID=1160895 RepID=A0A031LKP4_9CREN|nr:MULTISPECIES: HIT family protein [Acidianus]EZQ02065.1 HIT family hydrolase [Candidatus Acidianus copahuensis]NON63350.1 HIT family protein [Acidianus sp. RZ1]
MCLFCKIANSEESAYVIYDSEKVMAFLDKFPISPGHTLVITKAHFDDFLSTSDDYIIDLAKVTRELAKAVTKAVKANGVRVLSNVGKSAGQVIFHVHVHIIPTWDEEPPIEYSDFIPRKEQSKVYYEKLQMVINQNLERSK